MSERMMWAAWRVWAAAVRDRQPPHTNISPVTAWWGGMLARLLDTWQQQQQRAGRVDGASNLAHPLEVAIETAIKRILAAGVQPPAELSRIASR